MSPHLTHPTTMRSTLASIVTLATLLLPSVAQAAVAPARPAPRPASSIVSTTPIGDNGAAALKQLMEAAKLRLTNFNQRIQSSSSYSAELKAAVATEVQRDIDWINTQEATVSTTTTAGDVKKLLESVRTHYEQLRFGIKRLAGETLVAAIQKRAAWLDQTNDRLAATGVTSAAITRSLTSAKQATEAARKAATSASGSFTRIVSNSTVEPNWANGLAQVKVAQDQLVTARKALSEALAAIQAGVQPSSAAPIAATTPAASASPTSLPTE